MDLKQFVSFNRKETNPQQPQDHKVYVLFDNSNELSSLLVVSSQPQRECQSMVRISIVKIYGLAVLMQF